MIQSKFRQALRELMTRQPQLRREFQAALREEVFRDRKAAVDRHYLVWQSLVKLEELAPEALELIRSLDEDVEAWHEQKILLAVEYLEAVVDSLRCKAEHEIADYECDPSGQGVPDESTSVEFSESAPPEVAEDNLEIEDFE